jgi:hypothetical protein
MTMAIVIVIKFKHPSCIVAWRQGHHHGCQPQAQPHGGCTLSRLPTAAYVHSLPKSQACDACGRFDPVSGLRHGCQGIIRLQSLVHSLRVAPVHADQRKLHSYQAAVYKHSLSGCPCPPPTCRPSFEVGRFRIQWQLGCCFTETSWPSWPSACSSRAAAAAAAAASAAHVGIHFGCCQRGRGPGHTKIWAAEGVLPCRSCAWTPAGPHTC